MAINQRKAGSILSYVYIFLSNTISLIYTPIFLGMLGQAEYGLIGTANSITSYLSLLSMGIGGSYIRFNAKARATEDKQKEYEVNGVFQTIYFVISIITLIIGAVLVFLSPYIFQANYTEKELYEIQCIMICTVLQFVVTFVFNTTAMAIQAYEKFVFLRICLLISCVLQPCLNIFALYLGGNAVTISALSLIVSTATYVAYYVYAKCRIGLKFKFGSKDKELFKNIFVFSGFLFLNTITDQLTFSTDNIVLSIVSGPIVVAIYTVGSSFKNYFMSFSTSASSVFAPQINKIIAENKSSKELDEIFIRIGRIQFYIVTLILMGYIFLGKQFINLWVGESYSDAYIIGLLLMASVYVPCFQNIGLEIQKAKNLHKARSIAYFLVAIVNIIMTIPFSYMLGGKGAALATFICMFIGTVIFMNIYNYKKVGINIPKFWKNIIRILPGMIIPVVCGLLIDRYIAINTYFTLLWTALLFIAVFFVSCWFISMNTYEKDLFSKPVKKIFSKLIRKGDK